MHHRKVVSKGTELTPTLIRYHAISSVIWVITIEVAKLGAAAIDWMNEMDDVDDQQLGQRIFNEPRSLEHCNKKIIRGLDTMSQILFSTTIYHTINNTL
ncbi:hypothetical protein BGX20_003830 [Mortierella sp. AD010]|nr:hypothetical protein BGX20_003830 [Mortierella sp. AD010]